MIATKNWYFAEKRGVEWSCISEECLCRVTMRQDGSNQISMSNCPRVRSCRTRVTLYRNSWKLEPNQRKKPTTLSDSVSQRRTYPAGTSYIWHRFSRILLLSLETYHMYCITVFHYKHETSVTHCMSNGTIHYTISFAVIMP